MHTLVYFESTENVKSAIQRERTMKGWKRAWKLALIERDNPDWDDLYGRSRSRSHQQDRSQILDVYTQSTMPQFEWDERKVFKAYLSKIRR